MYQFIIFITFSIYFTITVQYSEDPIPPLCRRKRKSHFVKCLEEECPKRYNEVYDPCNANCNDICGKKTEKCSLICSPGCICKASHCREPNSDLCIIDRFDVNAPIFINPYENQPVDDDDEEITTTSKAGKTPGPDREKTSPPKSSADKITTSQVSNEETPDVESGKTPGSDREKTSPPKSSAEKVTTSQVSNEETPAVEPSTEETLIGKPSTKETETSKLDTEVPGKKRQTRKQKRRKF